MERVWAGDHTGPLKPLFVRPKSAPAPTDVPVTIDEPDVSDTRQKLLVPFTIQETRIVEAGVTQHVVASIQKYKRSDATGARLTSENQFVSSMSEYETDASGLLRVVQGYIDWWNADTGDVKDKIDALADQGALIDLTGLLGTPAMQQWDGLLDQIGERSINSGQSYQKRIVPTLSRAEAMSTLSMMVYASRIGAGLPVFAAGFDNNTVKSVQLVEGKSLDDVWRDQPGMHDSLLSLAMRCTQELGALGITHLDIWNESRVAAGRVVAYMDVVESCWPEEGSFLSQMLNLTSILIDAIASFGDALPAQEEEGLRKGWSMVFALAHRALADRDAKSAVNAFQLNNLYDEFKSTPALPAQPSLPPPPPMARKRS